MSILERCEFGLCGSTLRTGSGDATREAMALEDSEDVAEEEDMDPEPVVETEPAQPRGLLSADTLESLKYFTEIRKRQAQDGPVATTTKPPPPTGLGLADYGSDEDD